MALKHALLSALSRGEALNGYKLSSIYSHRDERDWQASPTQVYTELSRMVDEELVAVSGRGDRGRTDYIITEAGVRELQDWLLHTEPDHNVRDDSSMRLSNFWLLERDEARRLIERETAFQRDREARLRLKLDNYAAGEHISPLLRNRYAVTALWLADARLRIGWLERLSTLLDDPEGDLESVFDEWLSLDNGSSKAG
ncbi:MAG: PadR family transcriptional regulator [Microbacteriaceae bacterium]